MEMQPLETIIHLQINIGMPRNKRGGRGRNDYHGQGQRGNQSQWQNDPRYEPRNEARAYEQRTTSYQYDSCRDYSDQLYEPRNRNAQNDRDFSHPNNSSNVLENIPYYNQNDFKTSEQCETDELQQQRMNNYRERDKPKKNRQYNWPSNEDCSEEIDQSLRGYPQKQQQDEPRKPPKTQYIQRPSEELDHRNSQSEKYVKQPQFQHSDRDLTNQQQQKGIRDYNDVWQQDRPHKQFEESRSAEDLKNENSRQDLHREIQNPERQRQNCNAQSPNQQIYQCSLGSCCSIQEADELTSLLKGLVGYADLEIRISNIQSGRIDHLQNLKSLKAKQISKENNSVVSQSQQTSQIQPLSKPGRKKLEISLQCQLDILSSPPRIAIPDPPLKPQYYDYMIQPQTANGVSAMLKLVLVHRCLISELSTQLNQEGYNLEVNVQKSIYRLRSQNVSSFSRLFETFKKFESKMDNIQILMYECRSQEQAFAFGQIQLIQFQQKALLDKLDQRLIDFGLSSDIIPTQFTTKSLEMAANMITGADVFIFAIFEVESNQIAKMQSKFSEILQNSVEYCQEQQQFEFSQELEFDVEMKKRIQKLQIGGLEIVVSDPIHNLKRKVQNLEIQFHFWFLKNEFNLNQRNNIFSKIKAQVEQILNPIQEVLLQNYNECQIWTKYLCQEFESRYGKSVIVTKEENRIPNFVKIIFKGERQMSLKEEVERDIKQFEYCEWEVRLVAKQLLKILSNQNPKQVLADKLKNFIGEHGGIRLFELKNILLEKQMLVFMIIQKPGSLDSKTGRDLLQDIVSSLEAFKIAFDYRKFLLHYSINDDQLEKRYCMFVEELEGGEYQLVSTHDHIEKIKEMINNFEKSLQQQMKERKIPLNSELVAQQFREKFARNEFKYDPKCTVRLIFDTIHISAPEDLVDGCLEYFKILLKSIESSIQIDIVKFSEKELGFISKKGKNLIDEFQKKGCEIKLLSQDQRFFQRQIRAGQDLVTLSYQGRELIISNSDILSIPSQAVVNSCNQQLSFGDTQMLSGVARKIFEAAGQDYKNFCQNYISRNQSLSFGKVLKYEWGNSPFGINYILSVATPIYSNGASTLEDFEKIKLNIKEIFKVANQHRGMDVLTFPILGGGASGYDFPSVARLILNAIINQLFDTNSSVQKVYIVEVEQKKLRMLRDVLNIVVEPPQVEKQAIYQWQWLDQNDFKNYDDESINLQIDEAYQNFLQNKQKREQQLRFPFTKQPGTHLVDLLSLKITDISVKSEQKIELRVINGGNKCYFIGQQQLDPVLNEYFIQQKLSKITQFQIFYKRHKIEFRDKQVIVQVNEDTGFERQVRFTPRLKNFNSQQPCNTLVGKSFNKTYQSDDQRQKACSQIGSIEIKYSDQGLKIQFIQTIEAMLKENKVEVKIDIPPMSQDDFEDVKSFILEHSLQVIGNIDMGARACFSVFKSKEKKLVTQINKMIESSKKYPIEWSSQNENLLKVQLHRQSKEFQKVESQFAQTDKGTIHAIYRIQNKQQYGNYLAEKEKLIQIGATRGIQYSEEELETYLWHGVRGQHPKVIYEGLKDAFDFTYSSEGMWGHGIYFAKNASYSRNYAYKLQTHGEQYNEKNVFLLCKVCTGHFNTCLPDKSLRRPPPGYDSVSGDTNGSTVYIIYGMDVRRAYPAYEVIFS